MSEQKCQGCADKVMRIARYRAWRSVVMHWLVRLARLGHQQEVKELLILADTRAANVQSEDLVVARVNGGRDG